ncbi:6-phosphogluconate dehydrogenase [Dyella sp. OK004]|uniref:NAD(P)-binding domain-containing protein n=1 Tax=Dyella sp. OK004 TaxID=1855292 RepID=UPI0008EAB5EB|nr:NAD(P)-binding domain-containing protein [Dyella sp. OK004]SFS00185.1 6-phosphogluconate dehydrogenase [Dyella sp. OK004]
MQIGMIGYNAANAHVAMQWSEAGYQVVGFDPGRDEHERTLHPGLTLVDRLDDLAIALPPPRTLWMALPDRTETERIYNELLPLLTKGDTVIDAGYSYYKDTLRRAHVFSRFRYQLIDVGMCRAWPSTDGGGMVIGGDPSTIEHLGWVFEALSPTRTQGWGRVGPAGSGHFARMIHAAMASAMAQMVKEGIAILCCKTDPDLDLPQLAEIWSHSDAALARLLSLTANDLARQTGVRGDASDEKWILDEASELGVATPVLACSLFEFLRTPLS